MWQNCAAARFPQGAMNSNGGNVPIVNLGIGHGTQNVNQFPQLAGKMINPNRAAMAGMIKKEWILHLYSRKLSHLYIKC